MPSERDTPQPQGPRWRTRILVGLAAFGAAAGVASVFFLNLCDLVYACGCVSMWAGAADHCNINVAGPPDCPMCAFPDLAMGVLGVTVAAQGVLVFPVVRRRPMSAPAVATRAGAALLAFPLVGGVLMVGVGGFLGYWS